MVSLLYRVEVLLRLHQQIVEQPNLLAQWGLELLEAEHRVRRRCLAHGLERPCALLLSQAIAALNKRGVRLKQSFRRRFLEKTLGGSGADKLLLTYLKFFDRQEFNRYQEAFE